MYASQLHQNNRNDKRSNDSRNKKKSNANRQQNVTNKDEKNENNKHKNGEKSLNNVTDKFKEVQRKHIEAAKKHIEAYESSSEEELENNTLLESVFKNYQGEKDQLQKTQDFLENVFQCNTAACLICIRTVKRTDSVRFLFFFIVRYFLQVFGNNFYLYHYRFGRVKIAIPSSI